MANGKHMPPWEICPLVGFSSGRPTGFVVERIHNAYTDKAKTETLKNAVGGFVFKTEADARAAITKALGRES